MRKHNTISNNFPPCGGVRGRVRGSFGSLAMRYYPDLSYKSALRQLRNEIRVTRGLLQALKECGYKERNRIITRNQMKVIEEFLGKP
jgi:hypothetical protein